MSKKTIYVGHRGTKLGLGVENTKEAYLEAARLGYQAIETDIRVTLDKKYICCHDENLIRLTRNSSKKTAINVQECHFKDIKDLELTEITNGVKRVGKICTFDEYLDICKEYNCIPIIELKWTNGIYSSNDDFNNANYSNLDNSTTNPINGKYKESDEALFFENQKLELNETSIYTSLMPSNSNKLNKYLVSKSNEDILDFSVEVLSLNEEATLKIEVKNNEKQSI